MTDPTNDIDALLRWCDYSNSHSWHAAITALVEERDALREENNALRSNCKAHQDKVLDLVFEMDALRKRIAELESQPPAASDLRERLVESALRGVNVSGLHRSEAELIGKASVWMVDAAIDAMRKGVARELG